MFRDRLYETVYLGFSVNTCLLPRLATGTNNGCYVTHLSIRSSIINISRYLIRRNRVKNIFVFNLTPRSVTNRMDCYHVHIIVARLDTFVASVQGLVSFHFRSGLIHILVSNYAFFNRWLLLSLLPSSLSKNTSLSHLALN